MSSIPKIILLGTILLATAYTATSAFAAPSGSWISGASIPTAVEGYGAAAVGNIHYYLAGFGFGLGDSTLNQRYDTSSNTWLTNGAPIPGSPRAETAAVSHGGLIYLVGGRPVGAFPDTLLQYNPATDSWTTLAPMPTPVASEHQVVVHGDKIYVVGGRTTNAPTGTAISTVQIYDIPSNTWTTGASIPVPRADAVAVAHGDSIYLIGGWDGSAVQGTVLIYKIAKDSWSYGTPMPSPRVDPTAGTCGDKIHVVGGASTSITLTGDHFVYDPAKNSWTTSTSLPSAQITAEIEGISDAGKIFLVGGGIFGSGAFNPIQNIWQCSS